MDGRLAWPRRIVAVLMLLWGFCDMTVPGVCQTDFHGTATSNSDTEITQRHQLVQVFPPMHQPNPESSAADPDDCWCCCSHIVPSPTFFPFIPFSFEQSPTRLRVERAQWVALEFFQPPKA
jgi:hypothetical protein